MADIYTALEGILKGMTQALKDSGMVAVYPPGVKQDELPAVSQGGKVTIELAGEKAAARMEYFDNKLALIYTDKAEDSVEADYVRLALSLLDPETADEKDIKYIAGEFSESLLEKVGGNKSAGVKMPTPVSKTAAKSGMLAYDPNTLANRLTGIYPELRASYKENIEKYGDFLAEEFFIKYGAPAVLATIRGNDKQKMKRLFNLLNEVYEDGTNETQGVIAVTILGAMENDQELLANCVDHMSHDLTGPVIQVNKYLASKGGKGSKMRLENPPAYKPKKEKGKNPLASMLGL